MIVKMLRKQLLYLGCEVIEATGVSEALELFRQHADSIDAVITDLTMPGMTGIELAQKLHAIRGTLPVILSTGYSEESMVENARKHGISKIIYKPFSQSDLTKVLNEVMNS